MADDTNDLDDYLRRSPEPGRRAGDDVRRSLTLALAIGTLVTGVFSAGWYGHEATGGTAVLAKVAETYQSKEVAKVEYTALSEQLVELRKQIDRLQASVDDLRARKQE
jgi:hypothetical protein